VTKKSTAPLAAPSSEPLPKVVSIDALRARRDEAALRASTGTAPRDDSPSPDEPMSESERDRLLEELRSELGDLPDVRLDKVIEARSKIARGYYDSERIRLDILGAMLEEERGPVAPQSVASTERATRKSSTGKSSTSTSSTGKSSTSTSSRSKSSTGTSSIQKSATKKGPTKSPSTKGPSAKKRPTKPRAR
jgi:hypothetical protein